MSLVLPPSPLPSELWPPSEFNSPSISNSPFLIRKVKRLFAPEKAVELRHQYFDERVWNQVAFIDHLLRFQLRWFDGDDDIFFCLFVNMAPKLKCLTHHNDAALVTCANVRLMLQHLYDHKHPLSSHEVILNLVGDDMEPDCPFARLFCLVCIFCSTLMLFFEDIDYDSTLVHFFHVAIVILRHRYEINMVGNFTKPFIVSIAREQMLLLVQRDLIPVALNTDCARCINGMCKGACWTETAATLYQRVEPSEELKTHTERLQLFQQCVQDMSLQLRGHLYLYLDIAAGHTGPYEFFMKPAVNLTHTDLRFPVKAMISACNACLPHSIENVTLVDSRTFSWRLDYRGAEEIPLRTRLDCIAHINKNFNRLTPSQLKCVKPYVQQLSTFVHGLCTPHFLEQYLNDLVEDPPDNGFSHVEVPPTPTAPKEQQ